MLSTENIDAANTALYKLSTMAKRDAKGRPYEPTYTAPLTASDVAAIHTLLDHLAETQAGQLDYASHPRQWHKVSKETAQGMDLSNFATRLGRPGANEIYIRERQAWEAEPEPAKPAPAPVTSKHQRKEDNEDNEKK